MTGPTIVPREALPNVPMAGKANAATLKNCPVVCWLAGRFGLPIMIRALGEKRANAVRVLGR